MRGSGAPPAFAGVFTLLFTAFLTNPHGPARRRRREHPILALAAAGQPRRPAVVLLPRRPARVRVADTLLRSDRCGHRRAATDGARGLSDLDVRGEPRGLLVGIGADAVARPPLLLTAVLLAGHGCSDGWHRRRSLAGKAGLAVGGLCVLFAAQSAIALAYIRPADPRELLVYTQTSNDVPSGRPARGSEPKRLGAYRTVRRRSKLTPGAAPVGRGAGTCATTLCRIRT